MVIGWLVIGYFNFCTFCYFCYSCYFAITYNFVYRNDLNSFLKQNSTTFLICFEQTLHCAACHALSTKWVKFVFLRSPLVLFFTYCPEQLHWGLADTVTYLKLWIFAWIGTIFFECKDFFFQQRTSKLQCDYTNVDETSGLDAPGFFLLQLCRLPGCRAFQRAKPSSWVAAWEVRFEPVERVVATVKRRGTTVVSCVGRYVSSQHCRWERWPSCFAGCLVQKSRESQSDKDLY